MLINEDLNEHVQNCIKLPKKRTYKTNEHDQIDFYNPSLLSIYVQLP